MKYTAEFQTTPLSQAAGAQYLAMDLDEAPACMSSRVLRRQRGTAAAVRTLCSSCQCCRGGEKLRRVPGQPRAAGR